MSVEERDKELVVRIYCSAHNILGKLTVQKDETPGAKHFSCPIGVGDNHSVVCNRGGASCVGLGEAIQELRSYMSKKQVSYV